MNNSTNVIFPFLTSKIKSFSDQILCLVFHHELFILDAKGKRLGLYNAIIVKRHHNIFKKTSVFVLDCRLY